MFLVMGNFWKTHSGKIFDDIYVHFLDIVSIFNINTVSSVSEPTKLVERINSDRLIQQILI